MLAADRPAAELSYRWRLPHGERVGLDGLEPRIRKQGRDAVAWSADVRPREIDLGRDAPGLIGRPPKIR